MDHRLDQLTSLILQGIAYARQLYAIPEVKYVADSLVYLSGTSGAFWLLSKIFGRLALEIHQSLDYSLAVLFAVFYNLFLAVLFSSVICLSIILGGGSGGLFLWYKIAGFVFIYVVLKAVYADKEGKIDEYSILGYLGGVGSFIVFLSAPKYLVNPVTIKVHAAVAWIMRGWIPRALTVLAALQFLLWVARLIIKGVTWIFRPVARLKARFFFRKPQAV